MQRTAHFILQGKGGVGKSFVASLLAQHYQATGEHAAVCVDTDPVNATFSGYEAFGTRRLELLQSGVIDTGRFDDLMMMIISEDADFVVDNGASCFVPLTKYLFDSRPLDVLIQHGREVAFHTVLTGGYGLRDTVSGFDWLAESMPQQAKIHVWLNEFFGPIEADGKTFERMRVYEKHRDRITAIYRLPKQNEQTFGRDLKAMLDHRLTFAEAQKSTLFNLFSKQRIAMMERQLLGQLATGA